MKYPTTLQNLIECFKKLPGVGEKTALKLLQDYKTLDGIYEHIDEISARNDKKDWILISSIQDCCYDC